VTSNLLISASGNVDHDKIVELVQKNITTLNKGKDRNYKLKEVSQTENLVIKKDIQQTHVIIGRKTFGYKNPDRLKVNLLSNIIGEGSSSRLFNVLRERNGLTYQINTFLNSFSDYSAFGVYFSTNEKQASRATELVYNEFEKIRNKGISKTEFSRAKEYMKGHLIMHLESTTNRMIRMAQTNLYFNRTKMIQESIDSINEMSLDDILEISQELLNGNSMSKVVVSAKPNLN